MENVTELYQRQKVADFYRNGLCLRLWRGTAEAIRIRLWHGTTAADNQGRDYSSERLQRAMLMRTITVRDEGSGDSEDKIMVRNGTTFCFGLPVRGK